MGRSFLKIAAYWALIVDFPFMNVWSSIDSRAKIIVHLLWSESFSKRIVFVIPLTVFHSYPTLIELSFMNRNEMSSMQFCSKKVTVSSYFFSIFDLNDWNVLGNSRGVKVQKSSMQLLLAVNLFWDRFMSAKLDENSIHFNFSNLQITSAKFSRNQR